MNRLNIIYKLVVLNAIIMKLVENKELNIAYCHKRPSIKDVCSQGGGGLSSADIFRTRWERGSSDADVHTFWCKNLRIFQNLLCVRMDKGEEVEPVRTFSDKVGGRSIFRDFL